jgi:hypothetical protein
MAELKLVYSLSIIMRKAWGIARHNAKHHGGGTVRAYIAAALRQSWAEAKALAKRTADGNVRMQAEIERIKALHTPAAAAARAASMSGFAQRCGMPQRRYGRAA